MYEQQDIIRGQEDTQAKRDGGEGKGLKKGDSMGVRYCWLCPSLQVLLSCKAIFPYTVLSSTIKQQSVFLGLHTRNKFAESDTLR